MNLPKLTFEALGLLAIASVTLISAEASTVTPSKNPKGKFVTLEKQTHAVVLKCKLDENNAYHSKGAILSLPDSFGTSKLDVALVTGHGLSKSTDCSISDFNGQSKKVIDIVFAKNYKLGTNSDWAIVSFKRLKGQHIIRYKLDSTLKNTQSLDNKRVSFAEARGLPHNTQSCRVKRVSLKTEKVSRPYFSHDCKAIPGQSGSPITQNIEGTHELMGLHIGSIWTLNSPITGKPGRLNYFRPYDEELSLGIKVALRQMRIKN